MEKLRSGREPQSIKEMQEMFKKIRRQYRAAARNGEEFSVDQWRKMLELDDRLDASDKRWNRNFPKALLEG